MLRRREGLKEKKCGCIVFEYGPPIVCSTHQLKEKVKDEREIRRLAREQSRRFGHDLSDFREYPSTPGKWVAHCHTCGGMAIVYDEVPARGDQLAGPAMFNDCRR